MLPMKIATPEFIKTLPSFIAKEFSTFKETHRNPQLLGSLITFNTSVVEECAEDLSNENSTCFTVDILKRSENALALSTAHFAAVDKLYLDVFGEVPSFGDIASTASVRAFLNYYLNVLLGCARMSAPGFANCGTPSLLSLVKYLQNNFGICPNVILIEENNFMPVRVYFAAFAPSQPFLLFTPAL